MDREKLRAHRDALRTLSRRGSKEPVSVDVLMLILDDILATAAPEHAAASAVAEERQYPAFDAGWAAWLKAGEEGHQGTKAAIWMVVRAALATPRPAAQTDVDAPVPSSWSTRCCVCRTMVDIPDDIVQAIRQPGNPAPQAVTAEMVEAAVRSLCGTAGKHIYTAFRNDTMLEVAVADALTAALAARQEGRA